MARRNKRSTPATQPTPPEVPQEASAAAEKDAADEPQGDGANPTWAPTGNDSAPES